MVELHYIYTSSLSLGSQVCGISEHLGQWNESSYDSSTIVDVRSLDLTSLGADISDNVSHVVLRYSYLYLEDRLKQNRGSLSACFLESHGSSNLECHL